MRVIKEDKVLMVDVDDTLLHYSSKPSAKDISVEHKGYGFRQEGRPMEANIEALKEHSERGFIIVVWSQAGYEWAESVVRALHLEKHVSLIMSKPSKYMDDLKCTEWMGQNIWKGVEDE